MSWEHGGRRSPEGLRDPDAAWMEHGLCRTIAPTPKERVDVFFAPNRNTFNDKARFYCERCPVQVECADYAWENGIEYGTYGGVTEDERRAGQRYYVKPKPYAGKPLPPVAARALELHRSGMNWRSITRETGVARPDDIQARAARACVVTVPTFEQAVRELMRLSGWTRSEVVASPTDAAWESAAYIHRCRRIVDAGER